MASHLVLLLVVGATYSKKLRLRRFKSDRNESWQVCSSRNYASIDGI